MKKEKVKIISNECDVCPYCNDIDLTYDSMRFHEDGMVSQLCTCNNCGRDFEQWYEMKFAGHNVGSSCEHDANDVLGKEIEYES